MGRGARPTFTSLFCGCGGFDEGFLKADFVAKEAFDNDADALASYNLNFKHEATNVDLRKWRSIGLECVDVLIAGPPCQGFSTIGHRRTDDPRNELLIVPAEVSRKLRPRVCVVENVMGVKSGMHSAYWLELRQRFRDAGYRSIEFECKATSFGLPQLRKRHVMIAWRTTGLFHPALDSLLPKSLSEVLEGAISASQHNPVMLSPQTRNWHIAQHIRSGQKLCNVRTGPRAVHTWEIPEVFGAVSPEERRLLELIVSLRRRNRVRAFGDADPISLETIASASGADISSLVDALYQKGYLRRLNDLIDLKHTFNGKFRRLSFCSPSPTVDTRFGDPTCFLHPLEPRGMSVREAARVQGFRDDFVFSGSRRAQFKSIGNAVPPPMSKAIATFVMQILRDGRCKDA